MSATFYVVYDLRTSTPQATDVIYCGRSESSAWHYQRNHPSAAALCCAAVVILSEVCMIGASNVYEPKGMVFWSQERTIMHVSDEEPRESLRGWLLYRHPDGQWVTLRKATDADIEAIYGAGVENGRVIVQLP